MNTTDLTSKWAKQIHQVDQTFLAMINQLHQQYMVEKESTLFKQLELDIKKLNDLR